MTAPVPTATLRLESQMTSPPKPIGFGVFDGDKMIAVLTLEELWRAAAELLRAQAVR